MKPRPDIATANLFSTLLQTLRNARYQEQIFDSRCTKTNIIINFAVRFSRLDPFLPPSHKGTEHHHGVGNFFPHPTLVAHSRKLPRQTAQLQFWMVLFLLRGWPWP